MPIHQEIVFRKSIRLCTRALDVPQTAANLLRSVPQTRQLLRGSVGAELGSTLIPLARLGNIRYGANSTHPFKRNRIKSRSKREGAFGAARFSGPAKEQARSGDVAAAK